MQSSDVRALRRAAQLLLLLVLTFVTLVPGGPVETRDFSALGGAVFWGFNAFLIALGIVALAAVWGMWRGLRAWAWAGIAVGWGYVFVVLLDLGQVFPTSPDAMPLLLGIIEILDAILAGYVIVLAHHGLGQI